MCVTCSFERLAQIGVVIAALSLGGCMNVQVPDPAVRYVAFGDSTTSGPADRNYWESVRDQLGEPADSFADEGQGGETTGEGVTRLEELLARELYPNAHTLLYWEGAGDLIQFIREHDAFLLFSPDDEDYPFSQELEEALDAIQGNIEGTVEAGRNGALKVYVATYYFLRARVGDCDAMPLNVLLPDQADHANVYVVRLNDRIRQAAQNTEAVLVDVAARAGDIGLTADNYFNCNHLSAEGNQIVAGVFWDAINAQNR